MPACMSRGIWSPGMPAIPSSSSTAAPIASPGCARSSPPTASSRSAARRSAYRKHWAKRFGIAPFLPMSRAEMEALRLGQCDIILVTGDAYIDHPSFGMALVGRLLEAQGFRVGIISQPDWHSAEAFRALGKPGLFFGITAGNMDSMVNRYTADRKIRSDDAYTPTPSPTSAPTAPWWSTPSALPRGLPDVPVVIGSIEASLRRIAHYDYWSRQGAPLGAARFSKADLLLFGNAERAWSKLAHRLAKGEPIARSATCAAPPSWRRAAGGRGGWVEIDSTTLDTPGAVHAHPDPYAISPALSPRAGKGGLLPSPAWRGAGGSGKSQPPRGRAPRRKRKADRAPTPSSACRLRAGEGRPGALRPRLAHLPPRIQPRQRPRAGAGPRRAATSGSTRRRCRSPPRRWTTSTACPTPARRTRPMAGEDPGLGDDPLLHQHHARLLRRLHLLLDHRARGRIIQSRSEASILHEIEEIRDKTPGFTGVVSDLGGPTANMYRLACKDAKIERILPPPVLRLSRHLREPGHRPRRR
jgi:hypothetical protein